MQYRPPHLDPRAEPEYQTEGTVRVEIDAENSETGRPYIVTLNTRYSPSDGWLESADIEDMEPATPGDWEAVPDVQDDEWVKNHWQAISDADLQ
jgi:hypothetical protein